MKRSMIAILCTVFLALAVSAQAQTPTTPSTNDAPQQVAVNRQLLAEIKALRRELLQQGIEFQQWKLDQINRELQQAQAEQQRLWHEEQWLQQEINELATTADGKNENGLLKDELSGERMQKLRKRQQPLHERVTELTGQASKEEKRLRQLTDKLKAENPRPTT